MVYYSLRLLLTVFNSVYFSLTPFGERKRLLPRQVGNGTARGSGEHASPGRGTG